MSDVSQGEGWWIASDGQWYPPESAPVEIPPQKHTGRNVALGIAGAFVLLLIITAIFSPQKKTNVAVATQPVNTAPQSPVTSVPPVTSPPVTAPPVTAAPVTAPRTPGLNQVVKDGDFAFTVTGMQCGVTHVGSDSFGQDAPAGSQWCMVTMNVTNDKTTAQTFFASNQKAINAAGSQLSADSSALFYLPGGSSSEIAQVNPGISVTATIPFQLSSNDSIKSLELHDSAFSNGVSVTVA
jgi:hypothetical protein